MTNQYTAGRKGLKFLALIYPGNIHWLNKKKMKTLIKYNGDVNKIANEDLNTVEH